jgi:hypothetical protein
MDDPAISPGSPRPRLVPPLQLAPVTNDITEAEEWYDVLPAAMGIEGLVAKAPRRGMPAVRRVVLPSPNGSTISQHLAALGGDVIAVSLRNASAAAQWVRTRLGEGSPSPRLPVASGGREVSSVPPWKTCGGPERSSGLWDWEKPLQRRLRP